LKINVDGLKAIWNGFGFHVPIMRREWDGAIVEI
jgi:hypothetical protein